MSQQYEEPNHGPSPSASYDRVYEAIPHNNNNMGRHTEQKISSQNPTAGQRLVLTIASLSLMFIVSFIALFVLINDIDPFSFQRILLFVMIALCFLGTVTINIIFNRRQ